MKAPARWFLLFIVMASAQFRSLVHAQEAAQGATLLFASDTQEPMWVEGILLRPNQNKRATKALFQDMLAQQPTELFLLGDVVNLGYKGGRWEYVDSALALAKDRGFNVHGLLGNHELMGRSRKGESNFQRRFPGHVRTGYVVIKDSIAVVLLNSNFKKLSTADIAAQDEWYKRVLARLDGDNAVRAVIVCCHHSPYSNSRLVGSSPAVQDHFVPAFLTSTKACVFISGHAHMFQHFAVEEKHFFVIGGGGGLHHPTRKEPIPEVCLDPGYAPMFHYLTAQLRGDALRLVSRRLADDFSGFEDGCDFVIDLPGKTAAR